MAKIHVGCGSWADDEYVGVLYPKELPKKERLRGYAAHFDRVEVNSTYYAVPSAATVQTWSELTPPGFVFDVKLHRVFSQSPKKSIAGDQPARLLQALQPIIEARKLGAFLLTLSPFFGPGKHSLAELDGLTEKLGPFPVAVELRHRGWVDGAARESTLDYFRRHGLAWVALDLPQLDAHEILPPIDEVTNPSLAYLRLHGRNPKYLEAESAEQRHDYKYGPAEIGEIAARIRGLAARAENVHVSVNTHAHDFAPKAALALKRRLDA